MFRGRSNRFRGNECPYVRLDKTVQLVRLIARQLAKIYDS